MNVLFASAEVTPFAKVGGLGDVAGSLPKALRAQGIDARVLMPLHGSIDRAKYGIKPIFRYPFTRRNSSGDVTIHYDEYDGVPIYFMASWPFFGEGNTVYGDIPWDMKRFVFFSQTILATVVHFRLGAGGLEPWSPDVLHVHDWHTALASFLLEEARRDPAWERTGSVLSIHNMAYQGTEAGGYLWDAGVPGRHNPDLVYQDKTDNVLGMGIAYSDMLSTVSPRYATEIQYPRFGEGLEGLVRLRNIDGDVRGVLNGIDVDRWNPATDPWIANHYSADNFQEARALNKAALQQESGLAARPDVPLIAMITRLVEQKGADLAIGALYRLLADTDCQFVVLGTGDPALEVAFRRLCDTFAWKATAYLKFDPMLSQRIYSACDLFLMPSRYEPCGLGQMMAMRYGALPIVRETGGLADTVRNYDNGDVGTGFVFLWEEADAVLNTLRWAVHTYRFNPSAFDRMQQRAMLMDFSWTKSAREYIAVYERALSKHLPASTSQPETKTKRKKSKRSTESA